MDTEFECHALKLEEAVNSSLVFRPEKPAQVSSGMRIQSTPSLASLQLDLQLRHKRELLSSLTSIWHMLHSGAFPRIRNKNL